MPSFTWPKYPSAGRTARAYCALASEAPRLPTAAVVADWMSSSWSFQGQESVSESGAFSRHTL
ncbi:hypothetical protein [Streptomyces sp. CS090A]|uniref:hypothetical protein n=1 Tax=Streptomyces sp. CS090A TaxID=2162710 RepID=UPI001EF63C3B|nr:hypothetical protein [Streptomyces sp. CS090A]